jgi:hypothetical protein
MKHLILTVSIFCLIACSKNEEHIDTFLDCDQIADNFKAYGGENIECQFHYTLTEYNNQQFIELNSHCADLTRPFVINENCEDICETLPYDANSECGKYIIGREIIEILFIEK